MSKIQIGAAMAGGVLKNDLIMVWGNYEWQETYYDLNGGNPGDRGPKLKSRQLANLKNEMTGLGVSVRAVRQSNVVQPPVDPGSRRKTFIVYKEDVGTIGWGSEGNQPPPGAKNADKYGDNPVLSAKIKLTLANGSFAIKYFAGLPDGVQVGAGLVDGNQNGVWQQKYLEFRDFLINSNWGLRVRAFGASPRFDIATLAPFPAGSNAWRVVTTVANNFDVGNSIQLRGVGPKLARGQKFNRIFKVARVESTTSCLITPDVVVPAGWVWNGRGTAEFVGYGTMAITEMLILGTTHRKRGNRGFDRPMGKAK